MGRMRTVARSGGVGFVIGFLLAGVVRGVRSGIRTGTLLGAIAAGAAWLLTGEGTELPGEVAEYDEGTAVDVTEPPAQSGPAADTASAGTAEPDADVAGDGGAGDEAESGAGGGPEG